ncbi:MAG: site-specific integrase, partial [Thermomonas sp.]
MPSAADRRRDIHRLPPLDAEDAQAIERFLDALWAERGLAAATLAAYRADLQALARWLRGSGRAPLLQADRGALFDYLAMRAGAGYAARSTARLLACLHAFYAHALRAGLRGDDPCALLQAPASSRASAPASSRASAPACEYTPQSWSDCSARCDGTSG